jgi:D-alanyl-D-alanine carboxypeptidase/D-alanyl-D-alanine-endopeptidase (penicillin-binding protein 4)
MTHARLILAGLVCVARLCGASGPDDDLAAKLTVVMEEPKAARARWGFQVVQLSSGRVLAEHNSGQFFIPASNTKLYSTALALLTLGPGYRFTTRLRATQAPDGQGVLRGSLRLIGDGDPTMSARTYPYTKGRQKGGALDAIERLADQVAGLGVRRIEGDILGDDSKWPWEPYPDGWALDDAVWEYGAPVSALTINDNAMRMELTAGQTAGDPVRISLSPALEYYWIDNRLRTETGPRRVEVRRDAGTRQIQLIGQVPPASGTLTEWIAVDDPALYAAHALHEALTRRGIAVLGEPRAHHRAPGAAYVEPEPGIELARHDSRPFGEIVEVVNKVSQNLHAEICLREAAFVLTRDGSAAAGVSQLSALLARLGVSEQDFDFRDGSGLSRLTLTTPATSVRLLQHMWDSPVRAEFERSLPIGGQDGTLERRFGGMPQGRRVTAKTGTLTHVNALAGYVDSATFGKIAFSLMVNASNGPASGIRSAMDRFCVEIAR